MALWNDKDSTSTAAPPPSRTTSVTDLHNRAPEKPADTSATDAARRAASARVETRESLLAAELTIEGKIQGTGSVRLAGRFKGDVHVDGNVSIDAGAHVEGAIQAQAVVVGGELTGNIEKAKQVDILGTGVVIGDVKADSITVASGSRMRGHVEFGWSDGVTRLPAGARGTGQPS